jgi:hypothetical protein
MRHLTCPIVAKKGRERRKEREVHLTCPIVAKKGRKKCISFSSKRGENASLSTL